MNKLKLVPLEVVNALLTNHSGQKRSLTQGTPITLQQKTKDALMVIKKNNNMSSISNTIDLMLATIMLYQLNDKEYDGVVAQYDKNLLKSNTRGVQRSVMVNGREFYSVDSVAKTYKISRQSVIKRIKNTANYKFRNWNYSDEDIKLKYSSN